ncbi:hypothetical protein N7532_003284 [Penicillium argentinense]|uniref:Uncharacterized protein n=1 Tax=Penicillium argentinense TaxID=1131581 RepID=A0A9W9FMR5_9EURO|nr:uncharacterized protein N7532_003284 [Penicillium argentinense]KAJ5102755.1 hypothetical protein N7532_003284 [Penicillium argentinense]
MEEGRTEETRTEEFTERRKEKSKRSEDEVKGRRAGWKEGEDVGSWPDVEEVGCGWWRGLLFSFKIPTIQLSRVSLAGVYEIQALQS